MRSYNSQKSLPPLPRTCSELLVRRYVEKQYTFVETTRLAWLLSRQMRAVDEDTQPLHRRPQAQQQQQQRRSSIRWKSNLMRLLGAVLVLAYLCSVVVIFNYLTSEYHRASIIRISEETDVSDCILLYGAFCNGELVRAFSCRRRMHYWSCPFWYYGGCTSVDPRRGRFTRQALL